MRPRFNILRGPSTPRGAPQQFWPDVLSVQALVYRWQTCAQVLCAMLLHLCARAVSVTGSAVLLWPSFLAPSKTPLASCKALGRGAGGVRRDVTSLSLGHSLGSVPGRAAPGDSPTPSML